MIKFYFFHLSFNSVLFCFIFGPYLVVFRTYSWLYDQMLFLIIFRGPHMIEVVSASNKKITLISVLSCQSLQFRYKNWRVLTLLWTFPDFLALLRKKIILFLLFCTTVMHMCFSEPPSNTQAFELLIWGAFFVCGKKMCKCLFTFCLDSEVTDVVTKDSFLSSVTWHFLEQTSCFWIILSHSVFILS